METEIEEVPVADYKDGITKFKDYCLTQHKPMVILEKYRGDIAHVCSVYKNTRFPNKPFVREWESLAILGKLAQGERLGKVKDNMLVQGVTYAGYVTKKHETEDSLQIDVDEHAPFELSKGFVP